MIWRDDPFWRAASEAALRATEQADLVLVPHEFVPLSAKFALLEYSWGLEHSSRRVAWCCSKADVDRLAPWVHETHGDKQRCAFANEVFVLEGNFRWAQPAGSNSLKHWSSWADRVKRYRKGVVSRASDLVPVPGAHAKGGPRVLVVGASGMGNVGDDLLAQVLADLLEQQLGATVFVSGPDLDPLRVKEFDALVVGGGGLIYACRQGRDETQNLANYLKFGPIAAHFGMPCALIGVGEQNDPVDPPPDSETVRFVARCLAAFRFATTRDQESADLLRRWGAEDVRTACDLLLAWSGRARSAVRPKARQPMRIALAGELMHSEALRRGLDGGRGPLAADIAGNEYDVLVMSDDDLAHAEQAIRAFRIAGASLSSIDLRGKPFELLVYLISSYDGLVTTRFHGLVLAALCSVPVLTLSPRLGKVERLLRQWGLAEQGVPFDRCDDAAIERLAGALRGELAAVPMEIVESSAEAIEVHRRAVAELLPQAHGRGPGAAHLLTDAAVPQVRPAPRRPWRQDIVRSPLFGGGESIGLCWAASTPETAGFGNLGDSLSAAIVCALGGRRVHHLDFASQGPKLVGVGSIAHAVSHGEAIIWGSGVSIRGGLLAQNVPRTRYDVRAIRGTISAQHLRDFGIDVPPVYGDPVWVLPSMFHETVEKRFDLGVIPHIQDVAGTQPDSPPRDDSLRCVVSEADAGSVVVINTWHEPTWEGILAKLRLILSCRRIVSQSFHGVVIAEAFGIPVLHFRQLRGAANGVAQVSLESSCRTDPRIWEFYKSGRRTAYPMYVQRRSDRTDWAKVIQEIDRFWAPFEFDPAAMVEAFPLPLAFDPLRGRLASDRLLRTLKF